jgi:hypothetical protein
MKTRANLSLLVTLTLGLLIWILSYGFVSENPYSNSSTPVIVVTQWNKTNKITADKLMELGEEENVGRDRVLFGWSRDFSWGKNLRWFLQKKFESNPTGKEMSGFLGLCIPWSF